MSRMLPIALRGACTHNLQHLSLDLHPGELVALTGPSGAGKSALALDTLYAEGQRRFVESFSPYARQFLERLERPPVDRLDPIAATVAVDRRAPMKSSRSTLATMADLEPYLSALFAAEAVPLCPQCGVAAQSTTPAQAAQALLAQHPGARAALGFPARVADEAAFVALRTTLLQEGFARAAIGTEVRALQDIDPAEAIDPLRPLIVVVDRVPLQPTAANQSRLQEAIELCWSRGGVAEVLLTAPAAQPTLPSTADDDEPPRRVIVGRGLMCPSCQRAFEPAHARLFSYNSPLGACPTCKGFGRTIGLDLDKVTPDPRLSLWRGAVRPFNGKTTKAERKLMLAYAERHNIPTDEPWANLTAAQKKKILEGEGTWDGGRYPGVLAWFKWLETRTYKMHVRVMLSRYREYVLCATCQGARLNPDALSYQVAGKNLAEWHGLTVSEALGRVVALSPQQPQGKRVQQALRARLRFLQQVGLSYLTLDRPGRTLSGGEAQRAGLTTALGAALTGTLFVLDEPTVGLHPTDVPKLATAIRELAAAGNTVLVVEHDEDLVRLCDRVIELGPGAGKSGGRLLFDGTPGELALRPDLPTGRLWTRRHTEPARKRRRRRGAVILRGARANNLRGIHVEVPLGVLCAVTGPSGSGKSTLVEDVLYRTVARAAGETAVERPGACDSVSGAQELRRAVLVDQSPLGRTARGNAATYTKAWDRMRARFAAEPDARVRGLLPGHFSFNVAGGRCEACAGEGYETVEMQFLADVSFLCPVCQGQRFKPEVLAVRHRGKSVAEVLEMTAAEALALFDAEDAPDPALRRALTPVVRVGLGYLPLGQPLSTLSGGEAQRLKLARALSESSGAARGTLYVIDEPSAGLHGEDIRPVVAALHSLVDEGASVVVVEHDLDVIAASDWVIDLGPGAGPLGGEVVAAGTPEQVQASPGRTGEALRLRKQQEEAAAADRPARRRRDAVDAITVEHAREHNLKQVSCTVPHGKLTVVTGPSGSGKSSLAFDVIYAEGQRRFMETLTPYARQFLPALPRPDVDQVSGVPPAIALEQRLTRSGANSTVATVTEVAHYLRLLFAKVGTPSCPSCGQPVQTTSADGIYQALLGLRAGRGKARTFTLYAPAVRARKGTYLDVFTAAARAGVTLARVDGKLVKIEPPPKLARTREHSIDLVVYSGPLSALSRGDFDRALQWGAGSVRAAPGEPAATPPAEEVVYSTQRACTACGTGVPELDPRWFSFNTQQGQCPRCEGRGTEGEADEGVAPRTCRACGGTRLSPIARGVRLQGVTYSEFSALSMGAALEAARRLRFEGQTELVAAAPRNELIRRLSFVVEVGLSYLSLDRPAATLSGGEMQRLRLSAQLGSGLTGALYVLDEPTIGLHPRDTQKLLRNLRALVDTGSTVLVVEHDEETIRAADHLLDLGPSGGRGGGRIVAAGPAAQVLLDPASPTARALAPQSPILPSGRPPAERWITLRAATAHNLKGVDLAVPVGRLCVVAGVSGSGKSTLVQKVFYPALRRALGLVADAPLSHAGLVGADAVRRALSVDQSPIGRTPRSVPATFLGIWDSIRRLYAGLPESKLRGFSAQRFSFNTAAGGRCPACEGQGAIVSEMSFLPDVVTPCEACGGARFEPATLQIRYRGLHIGDVLHLSADEAAGHFEHHPKIARPLRTLGDLGVGYVQIGQGSNTLSGGEAQRLKLAAELTAGVAHEATVYVLDEPTTGLHLSDVRRLVAVLQRLVDRGDTLVVIEHQPDVIAAADWVVELGPEAGADGGQVVFSGTAAALARADTATGRYLAGRGQPVSGAGAPPQLVELGG